MCGGEGVDQLGADRTPRRRSAGQLPRRLAAQQRGGGVRGVPGLLRGVRHRARPCPGHRPQPRRPARSPPPVRVSLGLGQRLQLRARRREPRQGHGVPGGSRVGRRAAAPGERRAGRLGPVTGPCRARLRTVAPQRQQAVVHPVRELTRPSHPRGRGIGARPAGRPRWGSKPARAETRLCRGSERSTRARALKGIAPREKTGEAVHGSQSELRVGTDAGQLQRIGPAPVRAPLHALEVAPDPRRALDGPHAPAPCRPGSLSSRLSSVIASAGVPSSTISPLLAAAIDATVVGVGTSAPKCGRIRPSPVRVRCAP